MRLPNAGQLVCQAFGGRPALCGCPAPPLLLPAFTMSLHAFLAAIVLALQ